MRFPLIGIIIGFIYLLLLEVFGITIINPFTPIMLCIIHSLRWNRWLDRG